MLARNGFYARYCARQVPPRMGALLSIVVKTTIAIFTTMNDNKVVFDTDDFVFTIPRSDSHLDFLFEIHLLLQCPHL